MPSNINLNFKGTEACDSKSIIFQDLTGAYNVGTNAGGWGAPNYDLTDVLDVEITVLMPDNSTSYLLTMATLGAFLPNSTHGIFNIDMGLLGGTLGDTMTQGIYRIEYMVLVDDGSVTGLEFRKRKYVFAYSVVKCCVHKMLLALDMCDECPCGEEKQTALEAYTLYKAMIYAASCGSIDKAKKIFTQVNKLCSYQSTCKSCS